ncbi:hypothetical protein KFL_004280130 [Klebsormidium nitens]|uniref:RWD domain-containing protein n=1 Tax=Klebsormidium nitens TaxID=105231 RepID=A0A1Y1IEP2_KLENI|nr:hypothetical protein KFL_004280130 [Klebsormidium nitens]|eukprot:GAQ88442.1 hypothetical protein KFL_004280130 [Klebsormidium nitens]
MDDLVSFVDTILSSPVNLTGGSSQASAGSAPTLTPGLDPVAAPQEYLERWADEVAALRAIYDSDVTCIAEGVVRIRLRPRGQGDPSLQGDFELVDKHTVMRRGGAGIGDKKGGSVREESGGVEMVEKDGAEYGSAILGRAATESAGLWIAVARTERYPDTQPLIEVQNQGAISHRAEDELYDSLLLAAASQLGSETIYTLVELAVDFYTTYVEAAAARQLAAQVSGVTAGIVGGKIDTKEEIGTTESWTEYRPSPFAGGVMEVLGSLPKEIGVLNIENVLRQDLAELFVEKREVLRKKHPQLAVAADVIRMFQRDCHAQRPEHCPTFGKGIYLSPDSSYSVPYCWSDDAREHRLLVCAALPGWPEKVTRVVDQQLNGTRGTYDCRVSPNGLEWIFFDAAQPLLTCLLPSFL